MRAVPSAVATALQHDAAVLGLALAMRTRTITAWGTPEHDQLRASATGLWSIFTTTCPVHGEGRRLSGDAGVRTGIPASWMTGRPASPLPKPSWTSSKLISANCSTNCSVPFTNPEGEPA